MIHDWLRISPPLATAHSGLRYASRACGTWSANNNHNNSSSTNLAPLAGVLVPTELPLMELDGDRDESFPADPYPDTTKSSERLGVRGYADADASGREEGLVR